MSGLECGRADGAGGAVERTDMRLHLLSNIIRFVVCVFISSHRSSLISLSLSLSLARSPPRVLAQAGVTYAHMLFVCRTLHGLCGYTCMYTGLAYIHSIGQLHRDIKPSNILLGRERILSTPADHALLVKVADFGLCAPVDEQQQCESYVGRYNIYLYISIEPYLENYLFSLSPCVHHVHTRAAMCLCVYAFMHLSTLICVSL